MAGLRSLYVSKSDIFGIRGHAIATTAPFTGFLLLDDMIAALTRPKKAGGDSRNRVESERWKVACANCKAGRDETLWYYRAVTDATRANPHHPPALVDELERVVEGLTALPPD